MKFHDVPGSTSVTTAYVSPATTPTTDSGGEGTERAAPVLLAWSLLLLSADVTQVVQPPSYAPACEAKYHSIPPAVGVQKLRDSKITRK